MAIRHTPLYSLFGLAPERAISTKYHVERVSDRSEIHLGQVEPHRHPHLHQLTYWLTGEGEYRVETARHPVSRGYLCWIPAGFVHGFSVEPRADAIVLSMAREHVTQELTAVAQGSGEAVLRHPCVISPEPEDGKQLAAIFGWAEREYAFSPWGAQDGLAALARYAFVLVGRHLRQLIPIETRLPVKSLLFRRLEAKVEQRFREHPTVDELAAELGSTPYLLNQASRVGTGLKVSDYVRTRVMQEAQRLLLFTALDIAEVAGLAGYSDPSHFTRAFRAFHGETPRDWRDRHVRL